MRLDFEKVTNFYQQITNGCSVQLPTQSSFLGGASRRQRGSDRHDPRSDRLMSKPEPSTLLSRQSWRTSILNLETTTGRRD